MEITTTEQLKHYFSWTGTDFESLHQLEGGVSNFVWRMIGVDGDSSIIKHAEPYVAGSATRLPFPANRMDFEYEALISLRSLLASDPQVSIPKVHGYDRTNHVLRLEDAGPRTLKVAYTDESLDIPDIGFKLGRWLARLHTTTMDTRLSDNIIAKSIYRFPYTHLAEALSKCDLNPALGAHINEKYGPLLQTDSTCICHGDFWPGNILLSNAHPTVIDWEMTRRGNSATDVGQFAAEAWLLDHFRGQRGLLDTFLRGYREERGKLDAGVLTRVGVHVGVHLAFWPTRVEWGSEGETRKCVEVGVELIKKADGGLEGWVEGSLLRELA